LEQLFTWQWEKDEWKNRFVSIYKEGKLFGRIPNLEFTGVSVINKRQFYIIRKGFFIWASEYIANPKTNTKLCDLFSYSNSTWQLEIEGKIKYQITIGDSLEGIVGACFFKERKLFSKAGHIKVNSEEDIELLIYASFFVYEIYNSD
jgi:hypothetical protein